MTYEELLDDIKCAYSKEQCEQLIIAAKKLSLWVADFTEAFSKIVQAMQPTLKEITKIWEKIKKQFEETEVKETLPQYNNKYSPYKPKVKRILVYKKTIYYHIRSNC